MGKQTRKNFCKRKTLKGGNLRKKFEEFIGYLRELQTRKLKKLVEKLNSDSRKTSKDRSLAPQLSLEMVDVKKRLSPSNPTEVYEPNPIKEKTDEYWAKEYEEYMKKVLPAVPKPASVLNLNVNPNYRKTQPILPS